MGSRYPTSNSTSSVGGLVSTLQDYLRFVRMLEGRGKCPTTGVRVLQEETVRGMMTNWLAMKNVAGGQKKIKGWHDAGRGSMGWCPLGQVSPDKDPPDVWMGGIAGTFWAIDGSRELVVLHVTQVAGAYDHYGEELWRAGKAACEHLMTEQGEEPSPKRSRKEEKEEGEEEVGAADSGNQDSTPASQ